MLGELQKGVESYKEKMEVKETPDPNEEPDHPTPSANLINLKGYVCEETGANQFILRHVDDDTLQQIEVTMIINKGEQLKFEGLPESINRQLMAFS